MGKDETKQIRVSAQVAEESEADIESDLSQEDPGAGEPQNGEAAGTSNFVLYRGRPAWLGFWRSILISSISVIAGIATWSINGWILFGALVLMLILFSYACFERSLREFVVSHKRVEVISGFITKSSQEVRVQDIRTINVKKAGFQGLLGVGTVEFSSAGGDEVEVVFGNIWAANKVKSLVRKLQDGGG